jgi:dTDP-4-dehydrorhamnose reductase
MASSFIVTGKGGQLGCSFLRLLDARSDVELSAAYDHAELDIADPSAVMRLFDRLPNGPPDFLLNAAAYTLVDRCESDEDGCMAVNGLAPGYLAKACSQAGVRLIHVSTDYVFDGEKDGPYRESDTPSPRSAYGRSKLEGERRVLSASPEFLLVRASWVFGPGRNFVGAILRQAMLRELGKAEGPLRVVDDQRGCPTWSGALAEGIVELAQAVAATTGQGGIHHLASPDSCTWWDFARAILDGCGFADLEIERGRTADLDLAAARPRNSALANERAAGLGIRLPSWREGLNAFLASPDGEELVRSSRREAEAAR